MKKFLSLVLALTMMMSLVTINAGAKEFKDDKDITYDEAVAVISEIGVVDGREDGSFAPTDNLSRGAAAKIICNLILGPTTAAELHADTAPYKDVPTSNTFSGYIAYCAKEGIISGYADGTFRPAGTLTGYAFMKMLLGALGYDATYEGYTGGNWSINVAKQAIGIGLNKGLVDEFNGVDFVTREEAALYAFNTLKATMVDYDQKITTNVNGVDVTISQGNAKPVTWTEGINEDGNIKDDDFVQFAEEFFPKLVRKDDNDKFMAPANTWVYDKSEIGTYERTDLIVETYTTKVTGKDAYDLLKSGVIKDNDLEVYLDGVVPTGSELFDKDDMVRSNTSKLGATGDGVLTKVYLDTDKDVITFVSINTWLAKATADYSESKEYAPLSVYTGIGTTKTYNVDVEDVANVTDVAKDTFYQVNISKKDNTNGEVVILKDVEVLEDSTVTKFSSSNEGKGTGKVTKLTTGGEEYKANVKAFYDKDVLNEYNESLLTDNTYTVYVDANGYFLGIELFEGTKNYVFIPGYDLDGSHIGTSTAKASAIFLDGTMKTITVDVKDTNTNIDKARTEANNNAADVDDHAALSFQPWGGGKEDLNQWYTYTVDADGTYTLKPAVRMTTTAYTDVSKEDVIRTDNLSIVGDSKNDNRVYGEDATVFVTVDVGKVSDGTNMDAITDVDGVYTGVQNVDIEIDKDTVATRMGQVFTVYDSDYYVIGAVVIGEATGSAQNLAYILSGAKSEEKKDDTYYWTFEAVLNGQVQTLTAKSKYSSTITPLTKGTVMELRFDGDYVTSIKAVKAEDVYTDMTKPIDGQDVYQMLNLKAGIGAGESTLNLQGRTMYITANREDVGLAFASDAKAVVIQDENKKSDVKTEFTSVGSAISHLADADTNTAGTQYAGNIYAVLNSNGLAQWVVFDSATPLNTGSQGGNFNDNGSDTTLPSTTDLLVTVVNNASPANVSGQGRYDAKNGKLYLQFTGLTQQASKVTLPNVSVLDAFGAGSYTNLTLDVIKGTRTSKVLVLDFKASNVNLGNGINLANRITVTLTANDTVNEWYVDYQGTGVNFAKKQETVVNVAGSTINFSLGLPADAATVTYSNNSSTNVDMTGVAFGAITNETAYTAKLGNAGTAPVVNLQVASSVVVTDKGEGTGFKPVDGNADHSKIANGYYQAGISFNVNGNTITASGWTEDSLKQVSSDNLTAMTHDGKVYVGVQFTAPKASSTFATLKSYKLDGAERVPEGGGAPGHATCDYSNNTLYEWFQIATNDSGTVKDVVTGRASHTVDLVWELNGVEITQSFTVVIG